MVAGKKTALYTLMLGLAGYLAFDIATGRALPRGALVWLSGDDGEKKGRVRPESSALAIAQALADKRFADSASTAPSNTRADTVSTIELIQRDANAAAGLNVITDDVPSNSSEAISAVASEKAVSLAEASPTVNPLPASQEVVTSEAALESNAIAANENPETKPVEPLVASNDAVIGLAADGTETTDLIETADLIETTETAETQPLVDIASDSKENLNTQSTAGEEKNAVSNLPIIAADDSTTADIQKRVGLSEPSEEDGSVINFTAQELDGERLIALDDYRGKVVIIGFWVSWCSPCKQMLPWLDELKQEFGDQSFEVIGLGLDTELDEAMGFIRELDTTGNSLNFPLVRNIEGSIAEAYGVEALPSIYVLDRNLQVVNMNRGFSAKTEAPVRDQVKALLSAEQYTQNIE